MLASVSSPMPPWYRNIIALRIRSPPPVPAPSPRRHRWWRYRRYHNNDMLNARIQRRHDGDQLAGSP